MLAMLTSAQLDGSMYDNLKSFINKECVSALISHANQNVTLYRQMAL